MLPFFYSFHDDLLNNSKLQNDIRQPTSYTMYGNHTPTNNLSNDNANNFSGVAGGGQIIASSDNVNMKNEDY